MSDVTLYSGCWVKLECGEIIGPMKGCIAFPDDHPMQCYNIAAAIPKMWKKSGVLDDGLPFDPGFTALNVVAVYKSLSAASQENPPP